MALEHEPDLEAWLDDLKQRIAAEAPVGGGRVEVAQLAAAALLDLTYHICGPSES